jgi:hypothetical protein
MVMDVRQKQWMTAGRCKVAMDNEWITKVAIWKISKMAWDTGSCGWCVDVQSNSFARKMVEIAGIFLNLNRGGYARASKYMVGMCAWKRGV